MSVLIVTEPDDFHSVAVKLALKEKDIDCDLFFSADMPSLQENSIVINNKELKWNSLCADKSTQDMTSSAYSTIWWRRPRQPYIPDYAHPGDLKFIQRENQIFFQSIPYLFSYESWWVNPISSQEKIKSKVYQLKVAKECGLNIPNSMISNSFEDIGSFIQNSGHASVIYKSFTPNSWHDENGFKILYTQKISLEDLPADKMLQITPGIYQHYVEKLYELRITCFGSYMSTVRIDSQKNNASQIDWRKNRSSFDLGLSEVDIPNPLKKLIRNYMKKMNIVFGCFDFIVTPEEEYVFLEVNEQGQFLWIEEVLPQVHYLDIFCSFLMNRSFEFNWIPHKTAIRCADYDKETLKIINENMTKHVYLNEIKRTT